MSLFAELGLRRYLNAEDTFTTNGASCMSPEVYRAMEEISGAWVDLEQMQRRVGEALAQCFVSSIDTMSKTWTERFLTTRSALCSPNRR